MMTRAEAIDMFHSDDLIGIGMAADAVRRKLHPDNVVSYIIDRNINYTNVCVTDCQFCNFYALPGDKDKGYVNNKLILGHKIEEALDVALLLGRHVEEGAKGIDLIAGHFAVDLGHLGAKSDHSDRESYLPRAWMCAALCTLAGGRSVEAEQRRQRLAGYDALTVV